MIIAVCVAWGSCTADPESMWGALRPKQLARPQGRTSPQRVVTAGNTVDP